MKTIGGGTVVYAGIELAPDSASEGGVVGECARGGSIDIVVNGAVCESFRVPAGNELLVADGEVVESGRRLVRHTWGRTIRAPLTSGHQARVTFCDPRDIAVRVDDVTGLERRVVEPFDGGDSAKVVLRDDTGRALGQVDLVRGATLVVSEGAMVTAGTILARVFLERMRDEWADGQKALRRVLHGRTPSGCVSASSPCDGIVVAATGRVIEVRRGDGEVLRVRVRWNTSAVRVGDRVRAGDSFEGADRSHHRLLRAWGAQRLAEHVLDELDLTAYYRRTNTPPAYWSLAVRAMLRWRRVIDPGDTGLARNQVVSLETLASAQQAVTAHQGAPARTVPVLRGFHAMARAARRS